MTEQQFTAEQMMALCAKVASLAVKLGTRNSLVNAACMLAASKVDPRQKICALDEEPTLDAKTLRAKLVMEEALELFDALGLVPVFSKRNRYHWEQVPLTKENIGFIEKKPGAKCDRTKLADAAADLKFVAVGTFVQFGILDHAVSTVVESANMQKFVNGAIIDPETGKYLKPKEWSPPETHIEDHLQGSSVAVPFIVNRIKETFSPIMAQLVPKGVAEKELAIIREELDKIPDFVILTCLVPILSIFHQTKIDRQKIIRHHAFGLFEDAMYDIKSLGLFLTKIDCSHTGNLVMDLCDRAIALGNSLEEIDFSEVGQAKT